MNKKKILLILLIIMFLIILGIFSYSYRSNSKKSVDKEDNTFTFVCPYGEEIKITYSEEGDSATMFVEEKEYKLKRVISASGARYANDEETVIFWEHQGEAMVEIDGKIIGEGCRLKE
jgi:membrane-bound inhibitor of C-type lysozyme